MVDKLTFDFSNPTDVFTQAVDEWNAGSKRNATSMIDITDHVDSDNNDEKAEKANDGEPHAGKKNKTQHVAANESNNTAVRMKDAAGNMYERVCTRARKAVKDAVLVVRKGDRSDEARKKIQSAKDFVQKLKVSRQKNEHIDDIMCLSNDREDLMGGDTNICSQTMKEELEIFHGF